jgi:hypothetical protein
MNNQEYSLTGRQCGESKTATGQAEFDFVLVDHEESCFDDSEDDDSYDYCDDCSMLSCSEQDMEQGNAMSDSFDISSGMKESILTVPDVLMKDLDEAHAAAKLVTIDDMADSTGGQRADHYSTASSVISIEEEDNDEKPFIAGLVELANKLANPSIGEGLASPCKEQPGSGALNEEKQASGPSPARVNHEGKIGQTAAASAFAETIGNCRNDENTKATGSLSRTSNKKRRKKLKLMKKAQAAANAANQLAGKHCDATGSAPPLTSSFSSKPASKAAAVAHSKMRSSKKVSNVAVACATETMAAYRQELILRGIK